MLLTWTESAIRDRFTIYEYIELDNPVAALEMDELILYSVNRLQLNPYLGKEGRVLGTRELVLHQNYLLIYEFHESDGEIIIMAILHARRQWPLK